MTASETTELIKKIANGDQKAEHVLFQHYSPQIELIVRMRLKKSGATWEEQQDVVADTYIGLLQSLRKGSYDPSRDLKLTTYTVGIARKNIAQLFRKKNRNREFPEDQENLHHIKDHSKSILDNLISAEEREQLGKKLGLLKPVYKEVLLLRFYEKRSISEICQQLGLERKKVIDRIYHALKKFVKVCRNDDYFSIFSILLQIFI